jgi:hypothetical protein
MQGLSADVDEDTENGVYAGGEVRYLLSELYELDGSIDYANIDEAVWTVGTSLLRALNDNFALRGGVAINDDSDLALQAGIRWVWK